MTQSGTDQAQTAGLPQDYRGPGAKRETMAERHERRMAEAKARDEAFFYEYIRTAHRSEGECYFIGARDSIGGIVKIGFSTNVMRRLAQLRATSGPIRLELLARCGGGRTAEMHYHRKFAEHRKGGEYFSLAPEIEAEIARLGEAA